METSDEENCDPCVEEQSSLVCSLEMEHETNASDPAEGNQQTERVTEAAQIPAARRGRSESQDHHSFTKTIFQSTFHIK